MFTNLVILWGPHLAYIGSNPHFQVPTPPMDLDHVKGLAWKVSFASRDHQHKIASCLLHLDAYQHNIYIYIITHKYIYICIYIIIYLTIYRICNYIYISIYIYWYINIIVNMYIYIYIICFYMYWIHSIILHMNIIYILHYILTKRYYMSISMYKNTVLESRYQSIHVDLWVIFWWTQEISPKNIENARSFWSLASR